MMGIDGYADDFDGILDRLDADVTLGAYRSIRCLGASIGGVVALRAGLALRAERALSLGGRPIREYGPAHTVPAEALAAFDETFRRHAEAPTRIMCAYGADHEADRKGGLELARCLEGAVVPIPGVSTHGLPGAILKQGWLGRFFDDLLLADPPVEAPRATG